jgi:hypothetical protein
LGELRKCRQAYFSRTDLPRDGKGADRNGRPVTFWQTFWYSLGSFLLGKDDELNNAYFGYFGKGEYGVKDWWFPEYEHMDLGKALRKYEVQEIDKETRGYCREFERGYVYVNPGGTDLRGLKLPRACKRVGYDGAWKDPGGLPAVQTFDLPSHYAAIFFKTK